MEDGIRKQVRGDSYGEQMKELSEKESMGWVRRERLQDRKLIFWLWGWRAEECSETEQVCPAGDERLCPSESGEEEGGRCRVPGGGWQTLDWEVPEWALWVELWFRQREARSGATMMWHRGSHNGVITHLEPDILECEVRWALGSISRNKASGGDGIPVELFQTLKGDVVKVLHSICQQIWKTQQWPQDWKRSVFIPIPKKCNPKECSNYHTTALISHTSKVMLIILQARLQ